MKKNSTAQALLIEEVTECAKHLNKTMRGLSIGSLIKIIRTQLGMSQTALATRAKVPQSTISRLEQGHLEFQLSTLQKVLTALSCDLILAPLMQHSTHAMRKQQARKVAKQHLNYLAGTMDLEEQKPDSRFMENLLREEEDQLLKGPNFKLWENPDE